MKPPIRAAWKSRPGWSEFGRVGPNGNKHAGFDYYAPRGTAVFATGPGRVIAKNFNPDRKMGFGHSIRIQYNDDRVTLDAHFDNASPLSVGQVVTEDTVVGYIGNTGNAWNVFWDAPGGRLSHDHHQVWVRGVLTNPLALYGASTAPAATPNNGEDELDALQNQKLDQSRVTRELVRMPGTNEVYYSVNRLEKIWILDSKMLGDYQYHLRTLGYLDNIQAGDPRSYGVTIGPAPE